MAREGHTKIWVRLLLKKIHYLTRNLNRKRNTEMAFNITTQVMSRNELMLFFTKLKYQRANMVGLSKVQLALTVFPDDGQIQATDGLWNKGVIDLWFSSDMPDIENELATRLFDLSMTHTILSTEIEGVSNVYKPTDYQTAYIKVQMAIAPSTDFTTNIDADVIQEVLNMMKPKLIYGQRGQLT